MISQDAQEEADEGVPLWRPEHLDVFGLGLLDVLRLRARELPGGRGGRRGLRGRMFQDQTSKLYDVQQVEYHIALVPIT